MLLKFLTFLVSSQILLGRLSFCLMKKRNIQRTGRPHDASGYKYCFVVNPGHKINLWEGLIRIPMIIGPYTWEAEAVYIALRSFIETNVQQCRLDIYGDNLGLSRTLSFKGITKPQFMLRWIRVDAAQSSMTSWRYSVWWWGGISIYLFYIKSEDNPADLPAHHISSANDTHLRLVGIGWSTIWPSHLGPLWFWILMLFIKGHQGLSNISHQALNHHQQGLIFLHGYGANCCFPTKNSDWSFAYSICLLWQKGRYSHLLFMN